MSNIALVVLDTLRKDAFDMHFDWLPGRKFENAFSTANWTSPANGSMFTGEYPSEIGVHAKSPSLDVDGNVLPEQLQKGGYRTRCWTANPNISPNRQWDRGFNEFIGASKLMTGDEDIVDWSKFSYSDNKLTTRVGKYWSALSKCYHSEYDTWQSLWNGIAYARGGTEAINNVPDSGASVIEDLVSQRSFGTDEFLYLNLMEAHTPYYTPIGFDGPNPDDKITVTIKDSLGIDSPRDGTVQAYYDTCKYLSTVYREIFKELSSSFDYVITVADHGEMLGESDVWNHTYGLFPEITHVPLVISGKDLTGRTDAMVSHLDIYQTVLAMADINGQSRGRNLLELGEGKPVLTEYHGLIPVAVQRLEKENISQKLIDTYDLRLSGIGVPPRYYGHETIDGYSGEGKPVQSPKDVLAEIKKSISERKITENDHEMSEEVVDRLDDLGYV
ncbi:sulfatase-like hydrolase/transferase [Saliphagus infecundisoli]